MYEIKEDLLVTDKSYLKAPDNLKILEDDYENPDIRKRVYYWSNKLNKNNNDSYALVERATELIKLGKYNLALLDAVKAHQIDDS